MPSRPSAARTTVRLVAALRLRLAQDPAAQPNISAFVRVTVDHFIAAALPVESSRALGIRLASKSEPAPLALALPRPTLARYQRYARAWGNQTFGALVSSALAFHYFGAAPVVPAAGAPPPASGGPLARAHLFAPVDAPPAPADASRSPALGECLPPGPDPGAPEPATEGAALPAPPGASSCSGAQRPPPAGAPGPSVFPSFSPSLVPARGWRPVLLAFAIGQTHEFRRPDLPTSLARARKSAFDAADAIRDSVAGFRLTTRLTRRTLYITRVA